MEMVNSKKYFSLSSSCFCIPMVGKPQIRFTNQSMREDASTASEKVNL